MSFSVHCFTLLYCEFGDFQVSALVTLFRSLEDKVSAAQVLEKAVDWYKVNKVRLVISRDVSEVLVVVSLAELNDC